MKKTILLFISILWLNQLFAQDSIRSRDIYFFKYKIEKELIPEFNQVLLFIADINTTQNEVEAIIQNKTQGNDNVRLFIDEKVTVESDLEPMADEKNSLRADMDIVTYLNNFNTKYAKGEEPTIAISIEKTSELKKGDYFYFNVLASCSYTGNNFEGKSYNRFNRVFEIRLIKNNGWKLYISGIRFVAGDEMDNRNNYEDIVKTEDDVEKLIKFMDDEKKLKEIEDKKKIQLLKDEGDDLFDKKEYQNAIKKYREAYLVNITNKELKELIFKTKKQIDKEYQEAEAKERKQRRKEFLRIEAKKEQGNFNFKAAKVLCDSLTKDYGDDSPETSNLNNELARINAGLVAIESAMNKKDLKDAVNKCNTKIKDKSYDDLYKAEFYYRLANAYYVLDRSETSRIMDNINKAIELSNRKHQDALYLRSNMYVQKKDYSSAIEDASQMINNDSRNHIYYFYRAQIYEKDLNYKASIEDYGQAVFYSSPNPNASIKKAILELNTEKYLDVIETTNKGTDLFPKEGMLYYLKGLSKDKLSSQHDAGKDFKKAIKLGIPDSCKNKITFISNQYSKTGYTYSNALNYKAAIQHFKNAVYTDSSDVGLYMLSKCYNKIRCGDSALAVINALIKNNSNYQDIYHQRALAYALTKQYKLAEADFQTELARDENNAEAYYSKGFSDNAQKFYSKAAVCFEKSATLRFSDSAWYNASLNHYLSNAYEKAIACSEKARQKETRNYLVYYIAGRAFYDMKKYDKAISEFEMAYKINKKDFGLLYFLGMSHYEKEDFDIAYGFLNKCAEPNNYKLRSLYYSAKSLLFTGKPENLPSALNDFNYYLNADTAAGKDNAAAYAALVLLKLNKIEEAEKLIAVANEINPENQILHLAYACLYTGKGLYDEALTRIEKVMAQKGVAKQEVLDEKLLKTLYGMQKFKELKKKYYK